jgi:nicotinate-nucleotide adenylyltransferase
MRRLYFGGSFNPIHHGHLICAQAAAENLGFDRLVLVPAGQSPFKIGMDQIASADDRLEMCRLAARQSGGFIEVLDIEIRRPGPSYTIDTVLELKKNGENQVIWLIGGDTLSSLHRWHQVDRLLVEADLIVMLRASGQINWDNLPNLVQGLREKIVQVPQIDISATQIRNRVANQQSIAYHVPEPVADFISNRRLWR